MRDFQIVTVAALHSILRPVVGNALAADGFAEVGTLKWVRSSDAPIRQVFCFHQWKGGVLAPSWGLSLDFVPHVSGSRIKWHRTAKSAILDLRIDARDAAMDMTYLRGAAPVIERAPQVLSLAVPQATLLWDRARNLSALPGAFEWVQAHYAASGGLGFYNFVQHPMALAFVYARSGRRTEALGELEKYYPKPDDEVAEELRRLVVTLSEAA